MTILKLALYFLQGASKISIMKPNTVLQCPPALKKAAEKYRDRLVLGENPEEIPIEIGSTCHQISLQEATEVARDETKNALIHLYQVYLWHKLDRIVDLYHVYLWHYLDNIIVDQYQYAMIFR